MKNRITLETGKDINEFVTIVSQLPFKVHLSNKTGIRVNAKSILGVIASVTFNELWVECEVDIYKHIRKFIKVESNDESIPPETDKHLLAAFTFL